MSLDEGYAERAREIFSEIRSTVPVMALNYGIIGQSVENERRNTALIARALKQVALQARVHALSDACMNGGLWRLKALRESQEQLAKLMEGV